jgi:hypothetical protein
MAGGAAVFKSSLFSVPASVFLQNPAHPGLTRIDSCPQNSGTDSQSAPKRPCGLPHETGKGRNLLWIRRQAAMVRATARIAELSDRSVAAPTND